MKFQSVNEIYNEYKYREKEMEETLEIFLEIVNIVSL